MTRPGWAPITFAFHAEIYELGVLVYGQTREEAYQRAKGAALFALSTMADSGQAVEDSIQFEAA